MMPKIIENTKDFTVYEHEAVNPQGLPYFNYEILDKSQSPKIGIFFTGLDAVKFHQILYRSLKPAETMNKRLRLAYRKAQYSIDRGSYADKL